MNILHIATGLQKASGVTTFVAGLCNELAAQGLNITIATVSGTAECALDPRIKLESIITILQLQLSTSTIVHIHGLWSPILHKVSNWAHCSGAKVVWSTHGMTAPWSMAHKRWKKLIPWYLYQKRDLARAAFIHCTVEKEADWNHALGFPRTCVVPLGTHLPAANVGHRLEVIGHTADDSSLVGRDDPIAPHGRGRSPSAPRSDEASDPTKPFTILFVGRIYPVKGLVNLINAVAKLPRSGWQLRIVGPDQANHKSELLSLCNTLNLSVLDETTIIKDENGRACLPQTAENKKGDHHSSPSPSTFTSPPSVVFTGPKFDADLASEYDSCSILVLPSFTENFGATVVDALAHCKPVITTKGTPWQDLLDYNCGWWIDIGVEPLIAALREAMGLHSSTSTSNFDSLREMGLKGHALVYTKYTWKAVGEKMLKSYQEVLNG